MNAATVAPALSAAAFELRFEPLVQPGHALAFPCDGEGHVDLGCCGRDERSSYLFARAMVGREYEGRGWRRWPACSPGGKGKTSPWRPLALRARQIASGHPMHRPGSHRQRTLPRT